MKALKICLCAVLLLCILSLPCMAADDNLGEEDFFETTEQDNMGEIEVFDTTSQTQQPSESQTQQPEVSTQQGTEQTPEQTTDKADVPSGTTAADQNHGGAYMPEREMEWELPPLSIVIAILVVAFFGILASVILLVDYFIKRK